MKKNQTNEPLISIVLPVHNAEAFIEQAVRSIFQQSHKNWELIVVDDGSTDDTLAILKKLLKSRKKTKLIVNNKKLGVSSAVNKAIKQAKGQFIARMDGDDIALPSRLEKQLKFLQQNPDYVAVGGQCDVINRIGTKIGRKNFPTSYNQLYQMAGKLLPIQQPALMINTSLLPKSFKWYQRDLKSAEEHELFYRLLKYGKITNLKNTVLKYRLHNNNLSNKHAKQDFYRIFKARLNAVRNQKFQIRPFDMMFNFFQLLLISLLPSQVVFPLYTRLRGMK